MDKSQTLLVVDDNVNNIQVVGSILKDIGYKLAIAKDGKTALELAKQTEPDLILLDIMMPEMDGFEVCRRLKADIKTKKIPVIFLTAKSETDDIVKAFSLGGVDYVTKPFKKEELIVRVKNHLELVESKRTIEKQNEELAVLNASKDQLFSIISHDLRSPLGAVKSFLNIFSTTNKNFTKADIDEIVGLLKQNVDQTYNLLDNLLLWARSQRDVLEIKKELVNIHSIVESSLLLLKDVASEKNIEIQNIVEKDCLIKGDNNMLNTIFRNLISNAIKFSEEQGLIVCSAEETESGIEITVSDNGVGMTKDKAEKIFEPHSYVTTYGTAGEKGSGLGLKLCSTFIEMHSGKIWAESEEGKGTDVKIILPK